MPESRRLSVGYLFTLTAAALLLALASVDVARGQRRATPPSPLEVRSVEIEKSAAGANVVIGVSDSVEWVADFEPDGSLVVFLSRSVPGPGALDIESDEGLVAKVEVGFAVPDGIPTTRIVIRGRSPLSYDVERGRGRLRLRLVPADGVQSAGDSPTASATGAEAINGGNASGASPPATGQPASRSSSPSVAPEPGVANRQLARADAVEQDLRERLDALAREAETYRQRVAELHADRLQLIEDLRKAREETARGASTGEADRLAQVEERLAAREAELKESRADLQAAEERMTALSRDLDAARAENTRLSGDLQSLGTIRERVDELSGELAQASAERDELAGRLASASREAADGREALVREAQQQVEALRTERDDLANRVERVDADLFAARADVSRLEGELSDARAAGAAGADVAQAEVATLRREIAGLESDKQTLGQRLESVAAELAASRTRERDLADELASVTSASAPEVTSEALETLAGQLEASRQREAELRGWLARAPQILGATTMQVGPQADPCLKFRPTPSRQGPSLDCLVPGTSLEVLSMRDDWLRVRLDDRREGWVGQAYVEAPARRQAEEAMAARSAAEARIESLESERRSLADRLAKLESDGASARSTAAREQSAQAQRIGDLEAMLEESESLRTQLESHLAEAGADTAELEEELRRAWRESDDLRELAEQSVVALARAESTIDSLEAEAVSESDAAAGLEQELQAARSRIAALEEAGKAADDGQAELLRVSGELVEAQARIAALELSNDRLESDRLERENEREALAEATGRLADERARISELEAAVAAAEERATGLQADLDAVQSETASLRGAADDAEELRSKAEEQSATVAALNKQVADLRRELASAQGALTAARGELGESEAAARANLEGLRDLAGTTRLLVTEDADPCLQLRLAPGAGSEAVDCVEPGTSFVLLGIGGDWVEVAGAGDRRGWVASAYVEPEMSARLRQATAELERARASQAALERELESARQDGLEAGRTAGELEELRAELASANEARLAAEDALIDVEERRDRLAVQLDEARMASETSLAQRRRLEQSIADLESSVGSLSEQLLREEARSAELARAGEVDRAAAEAGADLQAALDAARARIGVLEREASMHAGLAGQIEQAERRAGAAEARARSLEEALVAARADGELLERRLAEAETLVTAASGLTGPVEEGQATETATGDRPPVAGSALEEALKTALEPLPADRPVPPIEAQPEPQRVTAEQVPPVRSPDLVDVARSWASAWSAQDVEAYLDHYSESFQPQYGLARSRWVTQRRERLTAPEFIEVEISAFRVRIESPERAVVEFLQSYRSNTFADEVEKTLELALEDGEWKIIAEVAR